MKIEKERKAKAEAKASHRNIKPVKVFFLFFFNRRYSVVPVGALFLKKFIDHSNVSGTIYRPPLAMSGTIFRPPLATSGTDEPPFVAPLLWHLL